MRSLPKIAAVLVLSLSIPSLWAQDNVKTVSLTFTTIDVPGALVTQLAGINKAGVIAGSYGQDLSGDFHGFSYSNGVFSSFDYPGEQVTVPGGINDFGVISGYATQLPNQRTSVAGFTYDGTSFTTIQSANFDVLYGRGINNAGTLVGGAGTTIYATKGFQQRSGKFASVRFPGSYTYAFANGINNHGVIVGYTENGLYQQGYMYKSGTSQPVDFPGAIETQALGVNDNGIIVGWYLVQDGCLGCGFALLNGRYVSFSYPGAAGTFATGISASGQIVGDYTFDYQIYHGFVTSPISLEDFDFVAPDQP